MLAKYKMYRAIGLQCPFCGRADTLEFAHGQGLLSVECSVSRGGCGARGPIGRKHGDAVMYWNRRILDVEGKRETDGRNTKGDVGKGPIERAGYDLSEVGSGGQEAV